MREFNLFRLDVYYLDGLTRKEKAVYLNPTFVVSIERKDGVTCIITTDSRYYTTYVPELIIKGLKDVQRKNNQIVLLN